MYKSQKTVAVMSAVLMTLLGVGERHMAQATFTPEPVPSATYKAITSKIDFSGLPDFTTVGSITDGTQTVTFSTGMEKRTVPGTWATWDGPPDTESATPAVLWTKGATSVDMLLSTPVDIFGFEAEPNPFATYDITADFYMGSSLMGSITRSVDGFAGARLFAGIDDGYFDKVVAHSTVDFAVAQVRYHECDVPPGGSPVPEPASIALLGLGAPMFLKFRKKKMIATA